MAKVDIDDKILEDIDRIAKRDQKTKEEIISDVLKDYVYKDYGIWKEKRSRLKNRGTEYSGKIPETEYNPNSS